MEKTLRIVFIIAVLAFVAAAGNGFGSDKQNEAEGWRLFRALDLNGDGRISRAEWDAVDENKDGTITPEEMQKYHLKGSSSLRWIDTNGDGHMDRYEFRKNFD